jgi:predicted nucleic acid-binding protein
VSVVLDASAVVAALIDVGYRGRWAESVLEDAHLAAPHLMPVEAANVLRGHVAAGAVEPGVGARAHARLVRLPVELFPYASFATRAWALRVNLTAYDAWYVALAESLDAPLVTLDRRLARAPGPRCEFLVPGEP